MANSPQHRLVSVKNVSTKLELRTIHYLPSIKALERQGSRKKKRSRMRDVGNLHCEELFEKYLESIQTPSCGNLIIKAVWKLELVSDAART